MRIEVPVAANGAWPRIRAKYLFLPVHRQVRDDDQIVTAFRDGTVTLRSNRRIEGFTNAVQEIGYQGVRQGDLVIHSMDGFAGAIGVSDSDGKASPVVHAYRSTPAVDARYYAYMLRMLAHSGFITSLAKGIRERSSAFDETTFRSLVLPCPPVTVQRTIADYLDQEVARIEALIAAKRRMIRLLEERFTTVVSSLVSVGRRTQVRRLTSLLTSGPRGWGDRITDDGDPFIRSANLRDNDIDLREENIALVDAPLNDEANRSRTRQGDVLVGITGANTGWIGLVGGSLAGGFVSQHVAILRPAGVLPKWLAYSLFSRQAREQLLMGQYGGTKQQLGLQDLAELWIYCPSATEQTELAGKLDSARLISRALASALAKQIELLNGHRQSLIACVITGHLEIPEVAV